MKNSKTLKNAQTNSNEWVTIDEAISRTKYNTHQILKLAEKDNERIRVKKTENGFYNLYNIVDILQYQANHSKKTLYDTVWDDISELPGEKFYILRGYDHRIMVSNFARVINLTNGTTLKPQKRINDNYNAVTLTKKGVYKNVYLHRIVAETQCPNALNKTIVHHINNNAPLNNKASNLIWVNEDEHATLHRLMKTNKEEYKKMIKKIKKDNSQKVYKIPHSDFKCDENFNYFYLVTAAGYRAFKNGDDFTSEILKEIAEGK